MADRDQRGLMYWDDGANGRILTMKGTWLFALDGLNGQLITSFGEGGWIHLGEGMDVLGKPNVFLNTPGYIYKLTFRKRKAWLIKKNSSTEDLFHTNA
jgi:glucose dehydrogenase